MSNKSVAQVNNEIAVAKKEALRRPHRFEVENAAVIEGEDANLLSDMIQVKRNANPNGTQSVIPLKDRIEMIFVKFPVQYELLGLYHGAGFTLQEIAEMRGDSVSNIRTGVNRAIARLKKKLTPEEFSSIAWALKVRPSLAATPRVDDSPYINTKSSFVPYGQPVGHEDVRAGKLTMMFGMEMIVWDAHEPDVESLDGWRKEVPHAHPAPKTLPVPRIILEREMKA